MPGDAAHDGGVFVVDFTLDKPMAKNTVVFRGRDERLLVCRWIKDGVCKTKFGEDLRLAELIQRLAG